MATEKLSDGIRLFAARSEQAEDDGAAAAGEGGVTRAERGIAPPALGAGYRSWPMTSAIEDAEPRQALAGSALEVLRVFLKLGLTSFGGPVAHLGYFRREFVVRRAWLDERAYADLVALCQFLPGPASSQTGFAIGLMRAGYLGGLAAWAGFTLPSAVAMTLFAYGEGALNGPAGDGLMHGLKLVAVAIVAQAVMGMAQSLRPTGRGRRSPSCR